MAGYVSIQKQLRAFGDFQLKAPTWTKDIVSNVSWLRTYPGVKMWEEFNQDFLPGEVTQRPREKPRYMVGDQRTQVLV